MTQRKNRFMARLYRWTTMRELEEAMANVNDDQCADRMAKQERSLGREIGLVRKDAQTAEECARKKVDKTTFRWTLGLIILAVIGSLGVCYALAFSAISGNHETQKSVARIETRQEIFNQRQEEQQEDVKKILERLR